MYGCIRVCRGSIFAWPLDAFPTQHANIRSLRITAKDVVRKSVVSALNAYCLCVLRPKDVWDVALLSDNVVGAIICVLLIKHTCVSEQKHY